MSSFHAGFSLGGAAGAVSGAWLGELGTVWGLLGPALLASLLLAIAAPFVAGEGGGFGGAGFAAPSRRLLPLAALAFVSFATEGAVGDWSGTYLARSGVSPGFAAAAYAAFSLLMITGRIVGDRIVAAAGPRATVGLGALIAGAGLAISAVSPGLAGGVVGFGLVGAGLANVVPVIFSVAGRTGSSSAAAAVAAADGFVMPTLVTYDALFRFGRDLGLRGPADRTRRHRRCRFRRRSALGDRHAGRSGALCGRVRLVQSRRPCARAERGLIARKSR